VEHADNASQEGDLSQYAFHLASYEQCFRSSAVEAAMAFLKYRLIGKTRIGDRKRLRRI